jgi:hypothetical protein
MDQPIYDVKCTNRQDVNSYSGIAGSTTVKKHENRVPYNSDNVHRKNVSSFGVRNANSGVQKPKVIFCSDVKNAQKEKNNDFFLNAQTVVKKIIAPLQDILKPTIRETTEDVAQLEGYFGGQIEKATIYDADDIPNVTMKEQNIHYTRSGMIGPANAEKATIYDADDIPNVTMKEQNIHDTRLGTIGQLAERGSAPQTDMPKKTTRETLKEKYAPNFSSSHTRPKSFNKESLIPKKTIKETINSKQNAGILTKAQGLGYLTNKVRAGENPKQYTSDVEYTGQAAGFDGNGGYNISEIDAKNTARQFIADNDYTGGANSMDVQPTSYADIYNMTVASLQQDVALGRAPTKSNAKVAGGIHNIGFVNAPCELKERDFNNHKSNITNFHNSFQDDALTKQKDSLENINRNDPENLAAYKNNPFAQSLNSSA